MSYPDITELSNAFTLCTCNGTLCSTQCRVCYSPQWVNHACVQQLWHMHASSDAGKAAAQRFKDMIEKDKTQYKPKPGDVVRLPVMERLRHTEPLPDDDKIEQCIDWMEEQGMPLQPWQANAFRAIMKHQASGGKISLHHYRQH